MKKYAAEFLGTGVLTLVVILAIAGGSTITPVLAMLTLALFVYTIGHVSGCHINPAVTAGLWSLGKISPMEALGYVAAQFAGALVASVVATSMIGVSALGLPVTSAPGIAIAEAIGMMLFAFGIAAVVHAKVPEQMSGVVIGGSLLLGLTVAGSVSNGVLNPAVALGIGSFNIMYLLGPIVGSVVGMYLYKCMCADK